MSVPLFILYGSATGNAESIAQDLASRFKTTKTLPKPFTSLQCMEANQFKKHCLKIWETPPPTSSAASKYGLLVITSTTGNGDAPENASRFIRYIKRKNTIDGQPMKHVAFSVLGLGDTNYDQYCQAAKVTDKKLEECGGTRVKELVLADEGTGNMEDVVDGWVEDIVSLMAKACLDSNRSSGSDSSTRVDNDVTVEEEKKEDSSLGGTRPSTGSKKSSMTESPQMPGVSSMPGSRPALPSTRTSQPSASSSSTTMPGSRPAIPGRLPGMGSIPNVAALRARQQPGMGSIPNVAEVRARQPGMGSIPNVAALRARQLEKEPTTVTTSNTSQDTSTVSKAAVVVEASPTQSLKSPTPLCILYGSATGNAQHIAQELAKKYESMLASSSSNECYFPSVVCCELDQYKKKCLSFWEDDSGLNSKVGQKHGVLIICSTTGKSYETLQQCCCHSFLWIHMHSYNFTCFRRFINFKEMEMLLSKSFSIK